MLVLTSAVLTILFVITIALVLLTRGLSQRTTKQQANNKAAQNVTPKLKEPAIYLDLPKSFPRDMVLPPRAKVTVSDESENDWTATFLTPTPLEGTSDFYIKELPKAGWVITNQSQGGGLTILYAKKEQYETIIAIGKGDLGITVSMTILKGS